MLSGLKFGATPATVPAVTPDDKPRSSSSSSSSKRPQEDRAERRSSRSSRSSSSSKKSKKPSRSHKKSSKHKRRKVDEGEEGRKREREKSHGSGSSGSSSDGSSSSDSSDDEGAAARRSAAGHAFLPSAAASAGGAAGPAAPLGPTLSLVRDSWMTPRVKSEAERAAEQSKRDAAAAAAESGRIAAAEAEAERARVHAEGGLQGRHRAAAPSEPSNVTVGDAGASWRAKALKRQRERAAEEAAADGSGHSSAAGSSSARRDPEPEWGAASRQRTGIDREQQRRNEGSMAAAGFPTSFGKQSGGGRGAAAFAAAAAAEAEAAEERRPRHAREDADTGMEMVETEEEIEAREARQAQESRARAAAAARAADMARLMKKPTASPTFSPPAGSPSAAGTSGATATAAPSAAGKSWRDKIRGSLTGTAAPSTPEGETAKLFSTPLVNAGGLQQQPTPSPLPSPSPSPPPRGSAPSLPGSGSSSGRAQPSRADPQRFAGMLGPEQLGMDKALHVVLEERVQSQSPSASPPSQLPDELPSFAAGFAPEPAGASQQPAVTGAPAPTAAPAAAPAKPAPKGASDAELNKLSAQATKAKLMKQTALYEQLQAKIAQLKADAKQQAESAASAAVQQPDSQHAHAAASSTSGHIHPSRAQPSQQRAQSQRPTSHAASIEEKIRLLRAAHGGDSAPMRNAAGREVVVLQTHDAHGRPIAAAVQAAVAASAAAASGDAAGPVRDPSMKNKKLAPNIDASGQRVAYFADDVEEQSLASLVSREKLSRQSAASGGLQGGHQLDRDWARSIARNDDFKLASLDEQFDSADFSMDMYDRSTSVKNQKRSNQERENQARSQQIHAANAHDSKVSRCWYCLASGSREVVKSLIVSIGVRVHLAIPRVNWITPGHVTLVPNEHVLGVTHMDDEVAEEINYFKAQLTRMWAAQSPPRKCVFLETVYSLQRNQHTIVHCVPLDADLYDDAEMYFAKAIDEADEQWATNKKIIRADQDKGGVRRAVPKNFNYFSVEFGVSDGGLAHTIEDAASFPEHFGLEVLLGMLGESAQLFLRNRRAGHTEEQKRLQQFMQLWKPFDWTRRLEGGDKTAPNTQAQAPAAAAATAGSGR